MEHSLKTVKVAYIGLDNAGKTTIINFLESKLTLERVIARKAPEKRPATVGTNLTSKKSTLLGLDLISWDFGGQEAYRRMYLKDKDRYLANIGALMFVIDIHDDERYEESLKYLIDVLNVSKEFTDAGEEPASIFILFHKFDDELNNLEKYKENIEILTKKILDISPIKDITFHTTSVYDDISILRAFSDVAIALSGTPQLIQNLLKEYCSKTASSAAILFDTRLFIVDVRASNSDYVELLETVGQTLVMSMETLERRVPPIDTIDIVSKINFPILGLGEDTGNIFVKKLDLDPRLYLITLSKNPKTRELSLEYLDILKEKLQTLLNGKK